TRTLQLAEQKSTGAQDPLLQVAEGVFDNGAAPDHHLRLCLHPLPHALERGLIGVPSDMAALGLRALRLQRTGAAVAARRIDALSSLDLLERQQLPRRALVLVVLHVVAEDTAVE